MARGKVCKTARNNDGPWSERGKVLAKCVPSTRTNCQYKHPKTAQCVSTVDCHHDGRWRWLEKTPYLRYTCNLVLVVKGEKE
jgi:hypothetical protein